MRIYRSRLSGPLLDRIDLHLVLPPVSIEALESGTAGESSAEVRARVVRVRALQSERQRRGETLHALNAHLGQAELERVARPDAAGRELLGLVVRHLGLSARGYVKVLRMARTVADLDGSVPVSRAHLEEAVAARSLDRQPTGQGEGPRGPRPETASRRRAQENHHG